MCWLFRGTPTIPTYISVRAIIEWLLPPFVAIQNYLTITQTFMQTSQNRANQICSHVYMYLEVSEFMSLIS